MSTYITNINGQNHEAEGVETGGAGQEHKIVQTGADGRLNETLMPVGIGADVATAPAAETLTAGNLVAIDENGEVVRASADVGGKDAMAFVKASYAAAETAMAYFDGQVTGLTGLTPGARYYLSETPGQVTDTPVVGSGKRLQFVGRAVSASVLEFSPDDSIVRV